MEKERTFPKLYLTCITLIPKPKTLQEKKNPHKPHYRNAQQNIRKCKLGIHKRDNTSWPSGIYPRYWRLVQHLEINHKQNKEENNMMVSAGTERPFENLSSILDKKSFSKVKI